MGELPATADVKVVSIVGARRCTRYGKDIAYRLAYALAQRGVIVVSGLAYGIDSCAHRGCLDAGGTTIAVLGTAIDRIYPARHMQLAERIVEKGAILSELPPKMPSKSYNFIFRNRIVAGLADVLVVVEAGEHSGTSHTVGYATRQDKYVYAVPGDIYRPTAIGCNRMIQDGALMINSIDDFLLSYLGSSALEKASMGSSSQLSQDARRIITELQSGPQSSEELIQKLGLSATDFNQQISLLELNQQVQSYGPNAWILC